jgi:hypothetical protein
MKPIEHILEIFPFVAVAVTATSILLGLAVGRNEQDLLLGFVTGIFVFLVASGIVAICMSIDLKVAIKTACFNRWNRIHDWICNRSVCCSI